jgi:hypothetical protein
MDSRGLRFNRGGSSSALQVKYPPALDADYGNQTENPDIVFLGVVQNDLKGMPKKMTAIS